jgi:hypothetical protein
MPGTRATARRYDTTGRWPPGYHLRRRGGIRARRFGQTSQITTPDTLAINY